MKRIIKKIIKKKILFLCDGACEKHYIGSVIYHLNENTKLSCIITPTFEAQLSLERQYDFIIENIKNYETIIWLLDSDTLSHDNQTDNFYSYKKDIEIEVKRHNEIVEKHNKKPNKSKNIQTFAYVYILINSLCLEFWYLLHFINTTKGFNNCKAVEKELKRHIKDYSKKEEFQKEIYIKYLKTNQETAISNAITLSRDTIEHRADRVDVFIDNFTLLGNKISHFNNCFNLNTSHE